MSAQDATTWLTGFPGDRLRAALWNHYLDLVTNITCTDEVQVLTPARSTWEARLAGLDAPTGARRIATPGGFIQQELKLWWPEVEQGLTKLGLAAAGSATEPRFVAIDMSQHLLERFAAPLADEDGGLVRGARTPARMQRLQVLDALARGIEHMAGLVPGVGCVADEGLDRGAMATAIANALDAAQAPPVADAVLGLAATIAARLEAAQAPQHVEAKFAPQLGAAIAVYADAMLRWRLLDHALQLAVYADVLWPNPRYQKRFKETTSWLLVEDLDELPGRWIALIEQALDAGVKARISLKSDPDAAGGWVFRGGLRQYVGADPDRAWALATQSRFASGEVGATPRCSDVSAMLEGTTRILVGLAPPAPDAREAPPLADLGRALADGLHERPRRAVVPAGTVKLRLDAYAVPEMLDAVARDLKALLATTSANRIAIVVPALSSLLIWSLRARVEKLGVPLFVFAGTNMLTDHRAVRLMITLARLCHPHWRLPPSRFELLEVLEAVTAQNPLKLGRLAPTLCPDGALCDPDLLPEELGEDAVLRYHHLWRFLNRFAFGEVSDLPAPERLSALGDGPTRTRVGRELHGSGAADLEGFFRAAFAEVWAPFQPRHKPNSSAEEAGAREISQIGQLIELASRFREVDRRLAGDEDGRGERFLDFLRGQPISERPFFKREPHDRAIMLATASQLAERGFAEPEEHLEHLFVLDLGSERWWKSDRKELVNGRVLAAGRPPGPYLAEEEHRDKTEKLARVLMACCCKVQGALWLHGCLTDEEGRENAGDLPHLIGGALGLAVAGIGGAA